LRIEGRDHHHARPAAQHKPEIGTWGFDTAGMDTSVAPGASFYQYANGKWLKSTPIPSDKSNYGMFTVHAHAHRIDPHEPRSPE
jgi:predicted metalloendopeptidase